MERKKASLYLEDIKYNSRAWLTNVSINSQAAKTPNSSCPLLSTLSSRQTTFYAPTTKCLPSSQCRLQVGEQDPRKSWSGSSILRKPTTSTRVSIRSGSRSSWRPATIGISMQLMEACGSEVERGLGRKVGSTLLFFHVRLCKGGWLTLIM